MLFKKNIRKELQSVGVIIYSEVKQIHRGYKIPSTTMRVLTGDWGKIRLCKLLPPASRRMGKVLFSQVSVCPHPGGNPSPRFFPRSLAPGLFLGYPSPGEGAGTPVPAGATPKQGYPPARTGWGYPPPPWLGLGYTLLPRDRTAERALATPRAVCLLGSRRTFLFLLFLNF